MLDDGLGIEDRLGPRPTISRKPPKPVQHRWFDQWLIARGQPLQQLVTDILQVVESREQRVRARRPDDQNNHQRMIEGVVCNLAYTTLSPPPTGWLSVNTRNGAKGKNRYDNRAFGKPYRKLLDLLAEEGLLERQISDAIRGEVSSIRPTERFAHMVQPLALKLADFASDPSGEVILLSRVARTYSAETRRTRKSKKLFDYDDTEISQDYRVAVQELNAFLDAADIEFLDDGLEPLVDPRSRMLTRRFTIFDEQVTRFDQVGRLFGGFWMTLKRERRKQIRINGDGEPLLRLDEWKCDGAYGFSHGHKSL